MYIIYVQKYIYIVLIRNLSSIRAAIRTSLGSPRTRVPAHVRTRARIGGGAAHNRPRRIEARPSASAIVRAARAGKAAQTDCMLDTDAVFHAPMFALNAVADLNACAPRPHAVHADGTRVHGSSADACAPKHARTHARAHPRSTCAHLGRMHASVIRPSM